MPATMSTSSVVRKRVMKCALFMDASEKPGGAQADEPGEDGEEGEIEKRAVPDETVETGQGKELAQQRGEGQRDDGPDQQRREQDAEDVDLADHVWTSN